MENSGVAEPRNIREAFADAVAEGNPLMERIRLDTMVTVVDSATFIADYSTRAPVAARPDLGDGGGMQPVVDLLVEQIECVLTTVVICTSMSLSSAPCGHRVLHSSALAGSFLLCCLSLSNQ